MSAGVARPLAAATGLLVDTLVGEPPAALHPVAGFGRLMGAVERAVYAPRTGPGVAYAALGLATGAGAGRLGRSTALAAALAVAGRALAEAAEAVRVPLAAGDLDTARAHVRALVGRDPASLDAAGIARAVVESVAENTVDAIVAPALWAAALGAPGALGYRAVNTMDAMVGHRDERYRRFGTAAARLDDVANWVPARVTALLVVAARPDRGAAVLKAARDDAPAHPSPNAGVAEAAFAAALDRQLGGTTRYGERVEERPVLGCGSAVEPADIGRAVALSRRCTAVLGAALLTAAAARALVARR